MKLVIQIPCFNEESTLAKTIADIPSSFEGISEVCILVIDDGCTDRTCEVASGCKARVVKHSSNSGLAAAFSTGIREALKMGADIIVNTDADNQYCGKCIKDLIAPIISGNADMVIGARPISTIEHFSFIKKILQKTGSAVVRFASGTDVPDAPSGFRAFSREAALKMSVFSKYSYTLETIIQAQNKGVKIVSVPIEINPPTRKSRLFKSMSGYIWRSVLTIGRIFILYRPFRFFAAVGGILFSIGFLLGIRFIVYYFNGLGEGHIQSIVLSSVFMISGFQTFLIGIVSDLISANRKMLEEIRYFQRKQTLTPQKKD
ncbi:MAG TPA: glycosyltransferase family 2 protein [bacterium]|mgnify:CR=1 FL=1|nr:glycosyltransferase family 2 protein [bacterium]HPS31046.1 glycosyltransferase family 2 protein [bacterium]